MALSKTLFRRLQALRAQCRAFSGTARAGRAASSTPHADVMGIFQDGVGRGAAKTGAEPPQRSRAAGLLSRTMRDNTPQSRILQETGFRGADFDTVHSRRYVPGDIVAPHDLSFAETRKFRFTNKKRPKFDVFEVLGLDPRQEYKNFGLLGEFVTDMGRIKGRVENGLKGRNQRRVARTIRRAVGMGLVPSVSRHPEILESQAAKKNNNPYKRRF